MAEADQDHLGGGTAIGGGFHLTNAFQQHLPGSGQGGHGQAVGQFRASGAFGFRQFLALPQAGNGFQPGYRVQQIEQVLQQGPQVRATLIRAVGYRQSGGGLAAHHGVHQVEYGLTIRQAEHVDYLR